MVFWFLIGVTTLALNVLVLFLFPFSAFRYFKRLKSQSIFDFSNAFLLLSLLLAFPVIIYENLMFIHIWIFPLPIDFNLSFLKLTFILASLSMIMFNLQLLVMKGLPDLPVSFLMVTMGVATGAMVVGLRLDLNQPIPIYYSPVFSGIIFIGGLMVFNIVGMVGFLIALRDMRSIKSKLLSPLHIISSFSFFIGPIFVFLTRIVGIEDAPLNLLFFPFLIAFLIELVLYLKGDEGYPVLGRIISVAIVDKTNQVVIGGYHQRGNIDTVKLSGMAMVATDTVFHELLLNPQKDEMTFGFGNIIVWENSRFFLVVSVSGSGIKLARICAQGFIRHCNASHLITCDHFIEFLRNAFHSFFAYEEIDANNFFFLQPIVS